jgi:Tfp pilus assembly protein PilF
LNASDFADGKIFFKNKEYEKAYISFEKAFFKDMANMEISFYLGRTAFELGNFKEAQVAFNRVLMNDENNLRVKLELGRIFLAQNNFIESEKIFREVLKEEIPQEVTKKINFMLKIIEDKKQKHYFNLAFILESGFETNINSSTNQENLVDYIYDKNKQYGITKNDIQVDENLDSVFYSQNLILNYKYKINKNSLFLKSSINIFSQFYDETYNYNLLYFGANLGLEKLLNNHRFSFSGAYGKVYFADEPLLDVGNSLLKYSYFLKYFGIYSEIYQMFKIKKFIENERDSFQNSINFSVTKNFSKFGIGFNYGYLIEDKLNDSIISFINNQQEIFKLNLSLKLQNKIKNNLNFLYRITKFEDEIEIEKKREDIYKSVSYSISKEVLKNLEFGLTLNYIENQSNYIPLDYNKFIAKINLLFTY